MVYSLSKNSTSGSCGFFKAKSLRYGFLLYRGIRGHIIDMGTAHILRSMVLIALLLGVLQLKPFQPIPGIWGPSRPQISAVMLHRWGFPMSPPSKSWIPKIWLRIFGNRPVGSTGCPGCQWVSGLKAVFGMVAFGILPPSKSRVS